MAWRFFLFQRLGRPRSPHLLYAFRPALPSIALHQRCANILPNLNGASSYEFYNRSIISRYLSYGSVNLVLSDGKPKFETLQKEPPKKEKWKTKKRLKMQRKREKRKRKEANRRDPRCVGPKGKKNKKHKFPTVEARIKYKIERAKLKESLLVEKLEKYEVPQVQGPNPKEDTLTGEERFYMKKMAQKRSNYVPVGRRGIFGGVILNMHLHWKKHETVKVVCKPCKPGQVHEYAKELARLSGGIPIEIIGNDTIVFYRGKNYVQPEVMSPVDTLSKKRALEKSKYEQSLETVRRFIAIAEKELELYYRHVALYGDPNTRNSDFVYGCDAEDPVKLKNRCSDFSTDGNASQLPHHSMAVSGEPPEEISDDGFSADESNSHDENLAKTILVSDDGEFTRTVTHSNHKGLTGMETGSDNDFVESVADLDDDMIESGLYFNDTKLSRTSDPC